MTIDLTGGLDDDREYVFDAQPDDPNLQQALARPTWDGETANGMLERSSVTGGAS
ncbi:hypothetical protein I6A84_00955 [Frankia sp. CNm7]|uniref:Uncharacterized protein n=1 Tax=Frankia nepalensis TaxID=1836974 RepID=A0A937RK86_9ACTN|nr:hypothetical protein [Frankia nepalensis]MBL7496721.1 hypothetical protein [Frankia nepalensis]MBL7511049.1 hypothetical protein [Frankia nepalensis]MBL7516729.1 hypothetical protein [Frankia nepalensis]MBL7627461.1 hypothetical protein [Frankia nepalensis]